jgi:hypothetical protein
MEGPTRSPIVELRRSYVRCSSSHPLPFYLTTLHSVVARKSLIVTEFVPPESPVTYCSCRTHASECYYHVWIGKYLRLMSSSIIRPHQTDAPGCLSDPTALQPMGADDQTPQHIEGREGGRE